MNTEIWKSIDGYERRFLISNHGRLKSINGRYKKPYITLGNIDVLGYRNVMLRDCGKKKQIRIHSLVAKYFCDGHTNERLCVNHKDGNKLNNHYENLEWVTRKENCDHALKTGLINNKGEKHAMSKLKESDVIKIRELYKTGLTHQKIADQFAVSRRQVGDIVNGKNWGWL